MKNNTAVLRIITVYINLDGVIVVNKQEEMCINKWRRVQITIMK